MQDDVTAEVNVLLELKKQYKDVTGQDFVPAQQTKKPDVAGRSPASAEDSAKPVVSAAVSDADVKLVKEQIENEGQKVREMKAAGAAKVLWCQMAQIHGLFTLTILTVIMLQQSVHDSSHLTRWQQFMKHVAIIAVCRDFLGKTGLAAMMADVKNI